MTAAVAQSLGLIETYGGIFTSPEPGSPAADAGIVEDDVVIAVDGISFRHSDEFAAMVSRKSPGSLIHLTTFRNGELMEVRLTLRSGNCPRQQNGGTLPLIAIQSTLDFRSLGLRKRLKISAPTPASVKHMAVIRAEPSSVR